MELKGPQGRSSPRGLEVNPFNGIERYAVTRLLAHLASFRIHSMELKGRVPPRPRPRTSGRMNPFNGIESQGLPAVAVHPEPPESIQWN